MKREMVEVILYADGTYEVVDIPSYYATERYYGMRNDKHFTSYYCPKSKWKYYLMKLLSTKDIDKQIEELKKKKRMMEELKKTLKETLDK